MYGTFDTEAQATYVAFTDAPVARTVSISDSVMVDVDAMGQPVGVEFLVLPEKITEKMVDRAVAQFPTLEKLYDIDRWFTAAS